MWYESGKMKMIADMSHKFFKISQAMLKKFIDLSWIGVLIFMNQTITKASHVRYGIGKMRREDFRAPKFDNDIPIISDIIDLHVGQDVTSKIQKTLDCNEKSVLDSELNISACEKIFQRKFLMLPEHPQHLTDGIKSGANNVRIYHENEILPNLSDTVADKTFESFLEAPYLDIAGRRE